MSSSPTVPDFERRQHVATFVAGFVVAHIALFPEVRFTRIELYRRDDGTYGPTDEPFHIERDAAENTPFWWVKVARSNHTLFGEAQPSWVFGAMVAAVCGVTASLGVLVTEGEFGREDVPAYLAQLFEFVEGDVGGTPAELSYAEAATFADLIGLRPQRAIDAAWEVMGDSEVSSAVGRVAAALELGYDVAACVSEAEAIRGRFSGDMAEWYEKASRTTEPEQD